VRSLGAGGENSKNRADRAGPGTVQEVLSANSQAILRRFYGTAPTVAAMGSEAPATTAPAHRVLVVDDEPSITELVATVLRYEGFQVKTAANGRKALAAVTSFRPHLMVLDVMLPDLDGFAVQKRLAEDGTRTPILFLSARDAAEDKVHGLTMGADDYVTKPFSLEELVARVRTVLRRAGGEQTSSGRLVFADLELDEDTHEVWRGGRAIELSPTEFNLLRYLMLNPRRVLSKAQILDHVWRYDFGGATGVVETYISYLRRKVDAELPHLIHTVRGVGYSLRLPQG
jgi:two-component system, OmpR family, response regulator